MAIKRRNMLCVKDMNQLDLAHTLLYEPYKNILKKFLSLMIDIKEQDFDPPSRIFHGLESIPPTLKEYYESLLGVTSYYQHSQGGKGKYLEKRLASELGFCTLDLKMSTLPIWLDNPETYRKSKLQGKASLTTSEKSCLNVTSWDWLLRDRRNDCTVDLGSFREDEEKLVLLELKNRVDSGGSAARREILGNEKFGIILNYLLKRSPIFRVDEKKFSFIEMLKRFKIEALEIGLGIIFNIDGRPATKELDQQFGFASSNRECFQTLIDQLEGGGVTNYDYDETNHTLRFLAPEENFPVEIYCSYGNDIPKRLFGREMPVDALLILKYDDIWLTQLRAIDERMILLKYKNNFTNIIIELKKEDHNLRKLFDNIIRSENSETSLNEMVKYLLTNYKDEFPTQYIVANIALEEYLGDIIQILATVNA